MLCEPGGKHWGTARQRRAFLRLEAVTSKPRLVFSCFSLVSPGLSTAPGLTHGTCWPPRAPSWLDAAEAGVPHRPWESTTQDGLRSAEDAWLGKSLGAWPLDRLRAAGAGRSTEGGGAGANINEGASLGFEGVHGGPLNRSIWGRVSEWLGPVLTNKLWGMAYNYRRVANQISFQINYLCQACEGGSWAAGTTCSF